jgi:hypothetical protein
MVDLDAIRDGDLRTNVQVYGGDIVYVPPTALASVGYAIQQVLFPFTPFFGVAGAAAGSSALSLTLIRAYRAACCGRGGGRRAAAGCGR